MTLDLPNVPSQKAFFESNHILRLVMRELDRMIGHLRLCGEADAREILDNVHS